jgi:sugar lactone lactonase YvrE
VTEPRPTNRFTETAVWGVEPGGVRFAAPNGLTIDVDGHVYSTDFQGGHLRKFTPDGVLEFEVGGAGAERGILANPIGVAVSGDGAIYVSESGSSRVSRFDPDGTFHSAWGGAGSESSRFLSAMGIAVSNNLEVFVADFGNHRIQVFDGNGGFLREWGRLGSSPGDFENPIGVQIGPAGDVWVVDSENERVQVFSQDGKLLRAFEEVGPGPEIISLNDAGEFYVSSPWADSQVRHFTPDGELIGLVGDGLAGPHGTATARSGVLYVAETSNDVIRTFTRSEDR